MKNIRAPDFGKLLCASGVTVAILIAGIASCAKGFPGYVQIPYWYVSYTGGFIRRGLAGTIVSPFIIERPIDEAISLLSALCMGIAFAYLLLFSLFATFVFQSLQAVRARIVWGLALLIFILSPGLPMLGFNFGTLDPLLILGTVGLMLSAIGGRIAGALALSVALPLIHEASFFLCLPLLAAARCLRPEWRRAATLSTGALLVTTLAAWYLTTSEFTWSSGVPLSEEDRFGFARWQLGQGIEISRLHEIAPISLFVTPILCALGMAGLTACIVRAAPWCAARILAGAAFTTSIIIVGTDTERFLSWGCVVTPLLCGMEIIADTRSAPRSDKHAARPS